MEGSFAEYILAERDWVKKMEIMYYLKKKAALFFDPSVVFKTLLVKLFLEQTDLEVEKNLTLTANLLCNCKKTENPSDLSKVRSYAKDGAEYLRLLGFQDKFCRTCEEVNRYSGLKPRELEADVLELVDQFGGMLLLRPERAAFKVEDAIVLLEHRNLKDCDNQYLTTFIHFIEKMEKITTNYRSTLNAENNNTVGISRIGRGIISEFAEEFNKISRQNALTMYDKEKQLTISIKTASRLYEMAKLAIEETESKEIEEEEKVKPIIPTVADIEAMKKMDEREFLK